MNAKTLRKNSALFSLNRYVQQNNSSQNTNPAIVTTMGLRDGDRGVHIVKLPNGGSGLAKSLTTGGIATGSVTPSTLITGGGNRVDARPFK